MQKKHVIFSALLCLFVARAAAQPFTLSLKTEIPIGTALLAGELFHNIYDFTAATDKWDGRAYDKSDVNAFDRALMHRYSKPFDLTGDAMMVLLPAGTVLFSSYFVYKNYATKDVFTQVAIAAETLIMAHTLPHIAKPVVRRVRPYNYYPGGEGKEDDWDRSFFSGHTTMAFAAATFGTYTFATWFPESPLRIPFAAVSYSLAALTGVSRVYAGCHFATDVLVGAAVGTAVGFLVPWLHTLCAKDTQISLSPAGFSITKHL